MMYSFQIWVIVNHWSNITILTNFKSIPSKSCNFTHRIKEPPELCPVCGTLLEISNSGKNLVCTNWECKGRKVSRVANMLAKMNLKGFGEQIIVDFYNQKILFPS